MIRAPLAPWAARVWLAIGLATAAMLPAAPAGMPAGAGTEVIPDLAVAPLNEFRIQVVGGRRLLRFSSTMVNVGAGHFELRGTRPSTSQPMAIHQVIYQTTARDSPLSHDIVTPAIASWAGDGHSHWHVNEIVRFDVWGSSGNLRGAKIGFCFLDTDAYDLSLPGASPTPYYSGSWCGHESNALAIRMGMSIGWGDRYGWFLPFQWVDITDLPSGSYTLRAKVDPHQFFVESNEANQCAYVALSLSTASDAVTVTGSGSACADDWSGTEFAADIGWAFAAGITSGCAPDLFCTYEAVTRQQMASFLTRARGLPPSGTDFFTDDEGSIHEDDINRIAAAGITVGCALARFCPQLGLSREQMASFLVRGFALPSTASDFFADDEGSIHEDDVNRLAASGITFGCGGTEFCPTAPVTRGQMAAFLHRAVTD